MIQDRAHSCDCVRWAGLSHETVCRHIIPPVCKQTGCRCPRISGRGTGSGTNRRSGLIHAFLRSCSLKKNKKQSLPVKGEGHCVQIKYRKKICTDDSDDILIFYFDFHSFLQSDAGVETNLLMMFKVFIVVWKKKKKKRLFIITISW